VSIVVQWTRLPTLGSATALNCAWFAVCLRALRRVMTVLPRPRRRVCAECVLGKIPRIPRVLRGGGGPAGNEQGVTQKRGRGNSRTLPGLFRAPSSDSMLNLESTARVVSSESFACARWIFATLLTQNQWLQALLRTDVRPPCSCGSGNREWEKLSPRAAALLQQREREGTSEDGIGRDWGKSKKRRLELAPRSLDQLDSLVAGPVGVDAPDDVAEGEGVACGQGVQQHVGAEPRGSGQVQGHDQGGGSSVRRMVRDEGLAQGGKAVTRVTRGLEAPEEPAKEGAPQAAAAAAALAQPGRAGAGEAAGGGEAPTGVRAQGQLGADGGDEEDGGGAEGKGFSEEVEEEVEEEEEEEGAGGNTTSLELLLAMKSSLSSISFALMKAEEGSRATAARASPAGPGRRRSVNVPAVPEGGGRRAGIKLMLQSQALSQCKQELLTLARRVRAALVTEAHTQVWLESRPVTLATHTAVATHTADKTLKTDIRYRGETALV
jgi:hypothetical protein